MPKIPLLGDIGNSVPGMLDKFKTMLDTLKGPGQATDTEEALKNETDPYKIKLMEVELLMNTLNDIVVIQTRTLHELKGKYSELQKMIAEREAKKEGDAKTQEATSGTTSTETPPKEEK